MSFRFCSYSDILKIHIYLLGYCDMQMVASKEIKYARKIKSLSGIFNKCFKPNIVLLIEAGPFLVTNHIWHKY